MQTAPAHVSTSAQDEMISGFLAVSRALVALSARSLVRFDEDVSFVQYRVLVVMASRGPQRTADLAAEFGVASSTITRMCDRLHRKGLIRRYRRTTDRRVTWIGLTEAGRDLVGAVTQLRRDKITELVKTISVLDPAAMGQALHQFVAAAGEVPEVDWWSNWRRSADPDPDQADG
jgi:DNA-binding MarR family transcriptional regulator